MLELMRFDQSARSIMFEDKAVPPHHIRPTAVLGIIEAVLDQLENNVVARQGKD